MLQNVPRSVTAHQLQKSLDQRGWTGGFNYVHLPTRFGVKLAAWEVNMGFAFVNFRRTADAKKFRCW